MRAQVFLATLGLAGSAIAVGQLTANPGPPPSEPGFDDSSLNGVRATRGRVYDVSPCIIGGLRQFGSMGNFPTGSVGLALSTTGFNAGTVTLPWFVSPDVDHPLIGQNMYRITQDGRLEQVGLAWLKHAWAAVQGSACGNCQAGGNSRILGIACADTYGAGLNAEQRWLGPRWEVQPHAHKWMDGASFSGSHFARNAGGFDSGPHNSLEHRLRVRMDDLVTSGATYFYEGVYYLLKDHADKNYPWADLFEAPPEMHNNARHTRVNVSRNGNFFTFSDAGGSINGPLVARWGDVSTTATPNDEGIVYVSSRAVDLGGGNFRYEYVLFNMNFDREVIGLEIPVGGAQISDFGFHAPLDGYWVDGNFINESPFDVTDWVAISSGGMVRFDAPTPGGNEETNTIRYASAYTFWFTADAAPSGNDLQMQIDPRLPGNNKILTASVVGPEVAIPAELVDITMLDGEIVSGGVPNLIQSDDSYFETEARVTAEVHQPHLLRMKIGAATSVQNPTGIDLKFESHITDVEATVWLFLWNWDRNRWVRVNRFSVGMEDEVRRVNVQNAGRFVRANDGRIELKVKKIVFFPFTLNGFHSLIDQVEIGVR